MIDKLQEMLGYFVNRGDLPDNCVILLYPDGHGELHAGLGHKLIAWRTPDMSVRCLVAYVENKTGRIIGG